MALILGSKSPRRRELMALVTADFVCETAPVDEERLDGNLPPGTAPARRAQALAAAKARALFGKHGGAQAVIGCDTVVEHDGRALGKPADAGQARQMLRQLAEGWHLVHTAFCVLAPAAAAEHVETTRVQFGAIPADELEQYIKTAEPYDKAGAYGVQGWAARFIPRVEGCYYNVMGLPVAALWQRLRSMGLL